MQEDADGLGELDVAGVSARFVAIVEWMLGVRPTDRPQSVALLRAALRGEFNPPARARRGVNTGSDAAPAPLTAPSSAFEPTLPVQGRYSAPTRLDTAHQATRLDTAHQPTVLQTPTMGEARIARLPPTPTRPASLAAAAPSDASATLAGAVSSGVSGGSAPSAPRKGSAGWLRIAALAVVVIAAALAAWQFGGGVARIARPAALAPAPVPAPAVVMQTDPGPSIANIASVPQWGTGTSAPKPSH